MNILGVSAYYHDSAAALISDSKIVAAAQEERFSRIKHDAGFPSEAVRFCLSEAKLSYDEIDYLVFYEKPLLRFNRLLETYLAYAPSGFKSFRMALPIWLKKKLYLRRVIRSELKGKFKGKFVFTEHHESHAASAFFPSPFKEAGILTIDGVGEWATTTYGVGIENRLELMSEIHFPHSLGLLYSAFTYFCGFKVNSGEYKLMGLAPYGEPRYVDLIKNNLIDIRPDGSFRLNMDYFTYCAGLTMVGDRFSELFGESPRKSESELNQFFMDVAASIQAVTEEIVLLLGRHVHKETGQNNLCMAGGVALNCVANGRLLREGPFEHIWIQPAAGDAGGALGAAQFVAHQLLDNPRTVDSDQNASFFGPQFSTKQIKKYLDSKKAAYRVAESDELMCEEVAEKIEQEKVIGWFQGRMEFGPRALGGRSIIGDARSEKMQRTMNLKIKFRESFRPFAPVILRERVDEYFEMRPNEDSPYMLLVAPVQNAKRLILNDEETNAFGLEKLNQKRSVVPAITHVDYSARVQTTDSKRHGVYHLLLKRLEEKTGSPVMINTSFNIRGEPIVCTPSDAYRCFMGTNMDVLVMGRVILYKDSQPKENQMNREEYLGQFNLD